MKETAGMKLHQDETANECKSTTREALLHNKTHANLKGYGCLKKPCKTFENASSPLGKSNKMIKMIPYKEGGTVHKKYLKPGALSRLRDSRVNVRGGSSSSLWCKALGRKRVLLLTSPRFSMDCERKKPPSDPTTPKTPTLDLRLDLEDEEMRRESRLESLPLDLLVRILCHLHHDELGALVHVSRRIRKAVVIAKRFHFNYTTPNHNRQDFVRGSAISPKAPKHGPRPPARLSIAEMRQIAASLFQGSSSSVLNRSKAPSGLPKASYKSLASHRVLFYEDELCQAVSQNSIQ